ncbi:MAG: carbohydrate-binding domain-containing protein [Muribaculaceae bacterium]|nr:carbohydrate-binding domain-containing protein [Muribaculaceae bacterium]
MKSGIILFTAFLLGSGYASAQTLNIRTGQTTYSFPASKVGDMIFGSNNSLNIMECEFTLSEGTEIWVDDRAVEDNVVLINYDNNTASVNIAGNIARYVEAEVSGARVNITQNDNVSAANCGEITYRLAGISSDGAFSLSGSYKSTVELAGLQLTSTSGAALNIDNGKRINLILASGTANSLTDGTSGSQKGCIVCKGHLEMKGEGKLTVEGRTSHAIYAKEYIEITDCEIDVTSAVKDGINCNQYFLMKSGLVTIDGTGDDGIQVSYKDETDREAEDTGAIKVSGGDLKVSVSADAAKGIKCEGPMQISGGNVTIDVTGNGVWDNTKNKTKASACLASDEDMTIDGGILRLNASGGGGKGINCDGKLIINDGDISITTSGGIVAYINGILNTDYTGNTDRLDSDMKSSPKGIKADGDVEINGGEINVTTTGNGAEGIESKSVLTINDGNITVYSTDDAINSSSHLYIKGGNITVMASGNDGLDSNGNMYIQGGYIMAFGAGMPECGIDANEEDRYTVIFSGGTLLGVGGNNSVPSSSSGSTQPYVLSNSSVTADSEIILTDNNGTELARFTVPADYKINGGSGFGPGGAGGGNNRTSILITCEGLTNGSTYTLKSGTSESSVTARLTGNGSGPGWPH